MGKDIWTSRKCRLEILKDEIRKDEFLQVEFKEQDKKFRKALLFCAILAGYSYLGLTITTINSYLNSGGKHIAYLAAMLASLELLAGLITYYVWKSSPFNIKRYYISSRSYLIYGINKLSAQLQLAVVFLSGYSLLLTASVIFVSLEIKDGLPALLKRTMPVAAVTYILWLFLIVNLWKKLKKLKLNEHIGYEQINSIHQN